MITKVKNVELIGKKSEIVNSDGHVEYDMYLVKVTFDDGKVRKVRTFSEPGTLDENNKADVRRFIFARLDGLIEDSGRTNYLFLGRMLPPGDKYVADRFYDVDGEEAFEVFERNVYNIRDAVDALEAQKKEAKKVKKSKSKEKTQTKKDQKSSDEELKTRKEEPKTLEKNPPFRTRKFPERKEEPFVSKFGKKTEAPPKEPVRRATFLPTPKRYVLGDVHGFYGSYIEAMRSMTSFDTCFINGDVIDRGEDGVKILEDIMRRNKYQNAGPRVRFLMGNHEMQMAKTIDIVENHKLDFKDIANYIEVGRWSYFKNTTLSENRVLEGKINRAPYEEKELQDNLETIKIQDRKLQAAKKYAAESHKNVSEDEARLLYIWLHCNGGLPTLRSYLNLPDQRREAIRLFLDESPVMLKTTTSNQKFIISHASPYGDESVIKRFEEYPDCHIQYKEIKHSWGVIHDILEKRENGAAVEMWGKAGYKVIYGHTPQQGEIYRDKTGYGVNIDAGCGHGRKLALYCLDDERVQYFDQKVESEKAKPVFDGHEDR